MVDRGHNWKRNSQENCSAIGVKGMIEAEGMRRTDIFVRRKKRVKVIQLRQRTEKVSRPANLVPKPNHQAPFTDSDSFRK